MSKIFTFFNIFCTADYVFFIKPNPPEQLRVNFDHDDYLSVSLSFSINQKKIQLLKKKRLKNDVPTKWFSEDKIALFCHGDYFEKTPYLDEPLGSHPDNSEW